MSARWADALPRGFWAGLGAAAGIIVWVLATQISAGSVSSEATIEYPRELTASERQQYADELEKFGVEADSIDVYSDSIGVIVVDDEKLSHFDSFEPESGETALYGATWSGQYPFVLRKLAEGPDGDFVGQIQLVFQDHVVTIPALAE